MIEVKKLIPQIYNSSRDFGLFTSLMQILLNEVDQRSRILSESPDENILPYELVHSADLIDSFRFLLNNRGTIESLLHLIYLCGGEVIPFSEESQILDHLGPFTKYLNDSLGGIFFEREIRPDCIEKCCIGEKLDFISFKNREVLLNLDSDSIPRKEFEAKEVEGVENSPLVKWVAVESRLFTYFIEEKNNYKIFYINIKDSSKINQNLLKSLLFYLLPINVEIKLCYVK